MDYWINKKERSIIAKEHTKEMEQNYSKEIVYSIANTNVYTNTALTTITDNKPHIVFLNEDSVSAVLKYPNCCVLNFASYTHPGGMFIEGSRAQEEALCHESFLYNVLRQFPDYYEYNSTCKNRALYTNRALYSPNVLFKKGNQQCFADVLTCAAPNYTAAQRWQNVSKEENYKFIKSRIQFIKAICELNGVDTFVAGAFGCGVFGQDPKEVANLFKEIFATTLIKTIVYAVPGSDNNYQVFKEIFDTNNN